MKRPGRFHHTKYYYYSCYELLTKGFSFESRSYLLKVSTRVLSFIFQKFLINFINESLI